MSHEKEDAQLAAELAPALALLGALAETANITRAAEVLGMPQPTASRRLAALAERVGAPLTVPAGRGVRLTKVGALLAASAERALTTLAGGLRQVRAEIDPERGRVVLGFLHLLGRSLVPELVRGFRASHPHVRFGLVQGSRQDVLDRLHGGEIDLALVSPPPADGALTTVVLAEEELFLAVPSGHRLAGRRRVRFAELAGDDFVLHEPGYGLRRITDELCAEAGFRPSVAFEGQESDTVRGLVAAGLGVALLTRFAPEPPAGVVELPLTPRVAREIALVWPAADPLTPAVRAFRDHVLEWPGSNGLEWSGEISGDPGDPR
ncbi:DNA-binding transcriptional regulator, LysR family [Amycolatopsis arida]|uniref:DNA-binding transcriptional regulator, LysR family n=1 Tax=Amycolatopsis arida TaxID=587909 RepID=A0A1I5WI17_9PSEU|nr:LysR family transcriptional regulator [Amycolatopsis arida]TDX92286.1 DNA-binding transcriptional LysR family regulator [Amycolatopsis arida]SFQ19178.1 DNA-binding transcriptional regulator, LysR family [Amycolatopsis arida]